MKYDRDYSFEKSAFEKNINQKSLTKDQYHKKLSGVCAGIAKHYELPRFGVRLVTVVSLIAFPVAVGVAYVVAALLMPNAKY